MEYDEIKVNEPIKFIRCTKKYGVAFFDFCFKINRKGIIKKIFISPRQQVDKKRGWYKVATADGFYIESEKELYSQEKFWEHMKGFYCTFHKSMSFSVSCPENTNALVCEHCGGDVWFKFKYIKEET